MLRATFRQPARGGVRHPLQAGVGVLDEDQVARVDGADGAVEAVLDQVEGRRFRRAHRFVEQVVAGDRGVVPVAARDVAPEALRLRDHGGVAEEAVDPLLAGVVVLALPAGRAVQVEDDVEATRSGPVDGAVEPLDPFRLREQVVEEREADAVETCRADPVEVAFVQPVVAQRGAEARRARRFEALLQDSPEGDVVADGTKVAAGGRVGSERHHPDLFHQPAAQVDAAQHHRATRGVHQPRPPGLQPWGGFSGSSTCLAPRVGQQDSEQHREQQLHVGSSG
jgi:hypothetical protein